MDGAQSPFGRYRGEVEAMIATGEPFEHVEDVIAHSSADEDEQAALWLYAWASRDAGTERRFERPRLTPVG